MADPVSMGAVAASAGAGLLQTLLQAQLEKEAAAKRRKQELEDQARMALQQGQQNQIALAGQAGQNENSSLQNLINVFQRAAR